ncbi:MAG: tetratricopeptide repeat protein [Mycobacteriaceae bacterium]|uniref:tetratricopeptide repeat protein n=1 Tax=Corynebacterium sp. TaxID=1720 RepID=UPI003F95F302
MSESSGDNGSRGNNRGGNRPSHGGRSGQGGYNRGGPRRDDRRGGQGGKGGQGGRDQRGGGHANRGGKQQGDDRRRDRQNGPQRSGYREERISLRNQEPEIPSDVSPKELDPGIRQELRSLSKDNADKVAGHLVMTAALMDKDATRALAHARAAKDRGGRVPITRETLGIAAYHAGEWKEALNELRAARRMAGGPGLLAVMADCERGLGKPEKAIELGRSQESEELDPESRAELAIVVAGAHHDLSQNDQALAVLEAETESTDLPEVTALRVTYAHADALLAVGDTDQARQWFRRAQDMDTEKVLDAEDRLRELDGK